jgi:hypothetical protein
MLVPETQDNPALCQPGRTSVKLVTKNAIQEAVRSTTTLNKLAKVQDAGVRQKQAIAKVSPARFKATLSTLHRMKREPRNLVGAVGLIGLYIVMVYWVPLIRRRLVPILMIVSAILVVWAVEQDAGGVRETVATRVMEPATTMVHHVLADHRPLALPGSTPLRRHAVFPSVSGENTRR